ncbi:MAG: FtsX-like permease family protein [Fuerstia sp.]|nr:FtsX-like permease family protein [Fuerstiella sp.]
MYKLLLCVRYLRTRYIALASIISVMLGVATMIVVNSVMAGFTSEMRARLHNFLADIVIESRTMEGIGDTDRQMAAVNAAAGEYIVAMTPTIDVPGMIMFQDPYNGKTITTQVMIQGIDPESKGLVGPLRDYLASYNPEIEDGVVIREALRSREEPLNWELTESAARYREEMKRQEALEIRGAYDDESPPVKSPPPEIPAADESPDFDGVTADKSDAVADQPPLAPDIFLPDPQHSQPESWIQTAPFPARVYLGEGIVSFQAQDPDTGKLHKVMLVQPGDDIILSTVTVGRPPEIVKMNATVVDSFRSGMNEYDTSIVLMNIKELQKNRGMHLDNAITSIHIRLKDYNDAPKAIAALQGAFPPGAVTIKTWEEKQGLLLSAVAVETAILNVLLFLIITVAGFGILAIFYMIVVEKTRDIGILKSLGASSNGVMSIFLYYGLGLGIVGSTAGVALGLLFVRYINEIEDGLSMVTGRKVFDEKIYYLFEIPTYVDPVMVLLVTLGAIGIAVLASILPARRAARLHPVRALRFE